MNKKDSINLGKIALGVGLILVVLDQISKVWALSYLLPIQRIVIISDVLNFTYVENTGAAFGIFRGQPFLLGIVSTLLLGSIVYLILKGKIKDFFLIWTLSFIVAGGTGNVIDRFYRGFVVDFIDLQFSPFKRFPVFNFADICVTVGAILLIGYVLFSDMDEKKEEDV